MDLRIDPVIGKFNFVEINFEFCVWKQKNKNVNPVPTFISIPTIVTKYFDPFVQFGFG
jgi:hypothetical protein